LAWLGGSKYSIIAASADGRWDWEDKSACNCTFDVRGDIREEWKYIEAQSEVVHFCQEGEIEWGEGLVELGRHVRQAIEHASSSARWVLLAVAPFAAKFPWNLLMRRCWDDAQSAPLVSVVPSFSWIVHAERQIRCKQRIFSRHPYFLISSRQRLLEPRGEEIVEESLIEEYDALRTAMEASRRELAGQEWSGVTILGHGELDEKEEFTSIVAENSAIPIWAEGPCWYGFGRYKVVLAHACFGGRVAKRFVGDLAGPPGLTLSVGTRLFCGPVLHVAPRTAMALHDIVVSTSGQVGERTIGGRYLRALSTDPMVGLYNLYGFADERAP